MPGRPTMSDVAERAGVSRALVSIVFRDVPGASTETRVRVRAAADELGYRPDRRARLLSRRRTQVLGVVFALGHEFHADLIARLYRSAAAHGQELALSGTTAGRDEAEAAADLLSLRCDALLLIGGERPEPELAELAGSVPVVVLARATTAAGLDVVRTDDAAGAALAARHLLDLGHTRVVHVDGGATAGADERRQGFAAAVAAAGVPADVERGGLTEDDGAAAAERLLARPDLPTGLSVFNDQSAAGVLAVLQQAGRRWPEDVSVVGYDDSRLARSRWTRLTTVRQDGDVLAGLAVRRAVERVEEPDRPAREDLVEPSLVVRASTGPPPGRS
ncbi:DNA-binding transcriptional regulator, LacI/PurR family [Microlunatus sagamiharensis]|uniref:DNA-binding transcriptional regulator, LacI/PurR family n=1 Tax=Microlunatus sagamiharensis TaxID=546874 RepID=A0A1H2MB78_9ACTN|nr:LacI family DNA-binding transcriptional regulator [Microlunatus sagamiharensis]SDU90463.1 DNA-binding transcriptional regulator, LacI/PurR family [Microlunatus sagamiharensis]